MTGFLDKLYGTLFRPNEAMPALATRQNFGFGLTLIVLVAILSAFSQGGDLHLGGGGMAFLLLTALLSSFVCWLLISIPLILTVDWMGGKGRTIDTLLATAIAQAPLILVPSLSALPNLFGAAGTVLSVLGYLVIYIWFASLLVIALRETHQMTTDQALVSVILSVVGTGAFFFFLLPILALLGVVVIVLAIMAA